MALFLVGSANAYPSSFQLRYLYDKLSTTTLSARRQRQFLLARFNQSNGIVIPHL